MNVYFVDGPLNGQSRAEEGLSYTIYYLVAQVLVSTYPDLEAAEVTPERGRYDWTGQSLPDGRRIFVHGGVV